MKTTMIALACLALLSACGGATPGAPVDQPPAAPSWSATALQAEAGHARAHASLPGLQLVVVENGLITAVASGSRSSAAAAPLLPDDALQMGSQTKAATAMLVARLVEQRKLRWNSTLGELFPAWSANMHAHYRSATVEQLLRHRSGVKADLDDSDAEQLRPLATGELGPDRLTAARHVLQQAPAFAPGAGYLYSNLGYMLLGMMAEQAGGASYQALMAREVFAPLQLAAGFGFPEDGGAGFASGHVVRGAAWQPLAPQGEARYAMDLVLAAGGMMLSAQEYGKLLRVHLDGLQGRSAYLAPDTFKLMHSPVAGHGFGWAVTDDAALGRVSAHAGSWGSYYAIALVVPGANRAVAVMCNCYGEQAVQQLDTLARRLALGVRP